MTPSTKGKGSQASFRQYLRCSAPLLTTLLGRVHCGSTAAGIQSWAGLSILIYYGLGSGAGLAAGQILIFSPCLGTMWTWVLCTLHVVLFQGLNDKVSIRSVKSGAHSICLLLGLKWGKAKDKSKFSLFFFPSFPPALLHSLLPFLPLYLLFLWVSILFLYLFLSLIHLLSISPHLHVRTHFINAAICIRSSFSFGSIDLWLFLWWW